MKKTVKKLLSSAIVLMLIGISTSAKAYDFFAVNSNGDTLYYNITSSSNHTIAITSGDVIGNYKGEITVPANVTYDGVTYSVTSIAQQAFNFCINLTDINLPNTITNIGGMAFVSCTGLTSLTIPNSVTTIDSGAFVYCSGLTNVALSNNLTTIGNYAFMYCSGLNTLNIPNSVTSIGYLAFDSCINLSTLTIGSGVNQLNSGAFAYCNNLSSITCNMATPPTIDSTVFYQVNKTIPVYVPCSSLTMYQNANGWSEFSNIQCNTSGLNTIDEENVSITLYPNPAKENVNISSSTTIKEISVYNMIGEKIFNRKINNKNSNLDVSSYDKGSYIVRLITDNGIQTKKIIIQ